MASIPVDGQPPPIPKRKNVTKNKPSSLLTPEENQTIYKLLGKKCYVSIAFLLHLNLTKILFYYFTIII